MSDIIRLGLGELAQAIRDRQVSCREVMTAFLARIALANPLHNAIVALRPEAELLAEADRHDALLGRGHWLGLLHGIPQAVKDLAATRGLATTLGSPILRDNVPAVDALFVERMRAAGAIVIGKTNTPEFGLGSQTYNPVHGATRNAHHPDLTAGGSSGGAAVALALHMLPVADGSDMMGSLRNPAAFNRVVGLRPSRGRVPAWPALDQFIAQLGTVGPMARNAHDCALLLSVLAGYDARDPLSLDGDLWGVASLGSSGAGESEPKAPGAARAPGRGKQLDWGRVLDWAKVLEPPRALDAARGKRIAWLGDLGGYLPMQDGVIARCEAGVRHLEGLGCRVETPGPAALGVAPQDLWECWITLRTVAVSPPLFGHASDDMTRAMMKPEAIWEAGRGLAMSAREVARASQTRTAFYQAWLRLFERFDFLVLPTAQVFPFDVNRHWPQEIAGRRMDTYHRWMEVVIYATLTGSPAISVPVPLDGADAGMGAGAGAGTDTDRDTDTDTDTDTESSVGGTGPIRVSDLMGIQIIGAPRDDLGVLRLAAAYEAAD